MARITTINRLKEILQDSARYQNSSIPSPAPPVIIDTANNDYHGLKAYTQQLSNIKTLRKKITIKKSIDQFLRLGILKPEHNASFKVSSINFANRHSTDIIVSLSNLNVSDSNINIDWIPVWSGMDILQTSPYILSNSDYQMLLTNSSTTFGIIPDGLAVLPCLDSAQNFYIYIGLFNFVVGTALGRNIVNQFGNEIDLIFPGGGGGDNASAGVRIPS
jgi:hypothetical protein